jgi:HTH-type transcriptional regulator/antitoxin HigA
MENSINLPKFVYCIFAATLYMGDNFNVDDLISGLFRPDSLRDIFDRRVEELKVSPTNASEILGIDYRAMVNILNGTKKITDFTNLVKLASFLQLSKSQVIQLYIDALEKNFPEEATISPKKVKFIKENFDLAALKQAKFINSITDFDEIDKKFTLALGLNSILEYQKPNRDAAFSSGTVKPKNDLNRSQWIAFARKTFEEINNPNEYDRQSVVEYFPQIRWHSTNIEHGLVNVIKELSKMGVTVIYQSPLPALHLRGATFAVNDKPCIVLTNYRGFYPTLWFALIHELFHVLFDWEEIRKKEYHLSDDDEKELTVIAKEEEANNFAREYLFSKEKTNIVRPHLNNPEYVKEFTTKNHVHESFAYVFNAFDVGKTNRWAWAIANKQNPNIDMDNLLIELANAWDNQKPVQEHAKYLKHKYHNQ